MIHTAPSNLLPEHLYPLPPQGKTGVIKLNLLYCAVYLQTYCQKPYKTSLNCSSGIFNPMNETFVPLLPFKVNSMTLNGFDFHILLNIAYLCNKSFGRY